MSYFERTSIQAADSPSIDAFDRLRVSSPTTVFDSKQVINNQSLFWDTGLSGAGATAIYNQADACTTLRITGNSQHAIRQTYRRFNYQPGKSQMILLTTVLGSRTAGIMKRIGYFSGDATPYAAAGSNGIFLELNGTALKLGIRKNGSDTTVEQADWNVDRFDGEGPSGLILDTEKTNIFFIDFEWLGVGRVRCGFVIDGIIYYAHYFNHANNETSVYMSTPNLPLRYEILGATAGNGVTGNLTQICCSVISEGGVEKSGIIRSFNTGATTIDAAVAGNRYVLLGLSIDGQGTTSSAVLDLEAVSTISVLNDNYLWELYLNPQHTGTYNSLDNSNSSASYLIGSGQTAAGGILLDSGYGFAGQGGVSTIIDSPLKLGCGLTGKRDKIVLTAIPFGANADIFATMKFREV